MAESLDVKAWHRESDPLGGNRDGRSMNDASTLFVGLGKMRSRSCGYSPTRPTYVYDASTQTASRIAAAAGAQALTSLAQVPRSVDGDPDVAQQRHRRIRAARRRCQQRAVGHGGAHPASTRMLASRTEECGTTPSSPASTPIRTMSFSRHHQARRLKDPRCTPPPRVGRAIL